MKRDMELIRLILLDVEAQGGPNVGEQTFTVEIPGRSNDEVQYHLWLLHEAGLIDAYVIGNQLVQPRNRVSPRRLTWAGHDFLDSVRDPEVWKKTRDGALLAGGWTFDLVKDLAKGLAKKKIEELTGVRL
ncbi:MAG: DUF2513 domain-containing protein [Microcystis sp. LE19-98.1E]|nr:DUF2513 domain-containing protein [Microcystis sp. LE19-98.1E]